MFWGRSAGEGVFKLKPSHPRCLKMFPWTSSGTRAVLVLFISLNRKMFFVFFFLLVCWFVSRITQKLLGRFPWNLDGGSVSDQNRPCYLLVWIPMKGTDSFSYFLLSFSLISKEIMSGSWWIWMCTQAVQLKHFSDTLSRTFSLRVFAFSFLLLLRRRCPLLDLTHSLL